MINLLQMIYHYLIPHFTKVLFAAKVVEWYEDGSPKIIDDVWIMGEDCSEYVDMDDKPDIVINQSIFTWLGMASTAIKVDNMDWTTWEEYMEFYRRVYAKE